MAYEFIKVEKKDHLTIVTINRPEVMNALHPPASHELDRAFNEFTDDPEAWVVIVTGAGDRAFSAGNDLKWQAENGVEALRKGMEGLKGGFGGITSRYDCFKPLIAAVNGLALGGGFEIVLSCDIIVASEKASFGLPEPRVGLAAGAGGMQRLPKRVPYHIGMGILLTGGRISAQEAQQYGLVNELVPPENLMSAAEKWAEKILECSPLAVRASKEGARLGQDFPEKETVAKPYPGYTVLFQSEDLMEGAIAFAEKRKPQWKGK